MKQIYSNLKKGEVKIKIENADDLWFLSQLIDKKDRVEGKTMRKIKLESRDEKTTVYKKPVFLTIEVEDVQFSKTSTSLRISGVITEEKEDIPKGSHHTFSVEEGSILTLIKDHWLKFQLDKLQEACQERPSRIMICVLDREEAYFALLKKYGYDLLLHITGEVEKKGEIQVRKGNFYQEILKQLEEYTDRYNLNKVIVASPSFWKEDLLEHLKNEDLKKKIFLAACSSVDETGINEVLKRPEVKEALKQDRVSQEAVLIDHLLMEIAKNNLGLYGLKDVEEAAEAGAISTLLVTDSIIKKSREENQYHQIENMMKKVEYTKGEVHLISTDHEAGRKLNGLGGIGAILRYKLHYK